MSIPTRQLKNVAFSTAFIYPHLVASGSTVTTTSFSVALPDGVTNPFYRVFIQNGNRVDFLTGYATSGANTYIKDGRLYVDIRFSEDGDAVPVKYSYFIYGGISG